MISSDVALAGEFKADEIDFFLCQINEREREREKERERKTYICTYLFDSQEKPISL